MTNIDGSVMIFLLTLSFFLLVYQLKKYQKKEYINLRLNLWSFYILELFFMIYTCTSIGYEFYRNYVNIYDVGLLVGIYPIFQSIIMYFLKSSEDIIQRISALDAICLISSSQIQREEFI
jgi:hypothetical protein